MNLIYFQLLAVCLPDDDIVILDAATVSHVRTLTADRSPVSSTRFSPDFTKQFSTLSPPIPGLTQAPTAFSPDGTKLFSKGVKIGPAGFSDPHIIIWDLATGKALRQIDTTVFVDKLAVSPNGRWLAVASFSKAQGDYSIRLWEWETGKLIHRLSPWPNRTFSMIFSADSSRLAAVGHAFPRGLGEAHLWDVATGKEVYVFTGQDNATCVAMTADGRMLATGSLDKTCRLWEIASGQERGRFLGHNGSVFSVDFSPDGSLLAAASSDAPVYLWNLYALKSKPSGNMLTKEDREKLWRNLSDTSAAVGFQAVRELIARPNEAPGFLEEAWKREPRATAKQMHNWVEDLSSDQFALRKSATEELERFVADHDDLLRDALQKAGTLEARQRLERLLNHPSPQRLRRTRMLEVLEQLRTIPARQFLQALANQKDDHLLAREAAAGLKRLHQQQ